MKRLSVITVESADDSTTWNMLNNLYNKEHFDKYDIRHCFIERADNVNELFAVLSKAVHSIKYSPVLLIHTGREFFRLRDVFPQALDMLIREFPEIEIGIQCRQNQKQDIMKYVSDDQHVIALEDEFFDMER